MLLRSNTSNSISTKAKKFYFFLKSFSIDIIASIVAFSTTWVAFIFSRDQQQAFGISATIIIASLLVIIYVRQKDRGFYYIALDKREDKEDWFGNGQFEFSRTDKGFRLTDNDPGFIFNRCLNWSDYKFCFKFKIKRSRLGLILRAINLSNYVMLQITESGIRPHLRVNGGWKAWEADQVGLEFSESLSLENWYQCEVTCDKNIVNIKVSGKSLFFDREWEIPRGSLTFEYKRNEADSIPVQIPFPINLEYGSIGFRNSAGEKAVVKEVLVEKL